ncbi:MAG: hypothetical protein ACPG66_09215 [Flavobacteriales bacterium]
MNAFDAPPLSANESQLRDDVQALTLPDAARVWIYTANRPLTADELRATNAHLQAFVSTWVAHGAPLRAEAAVLLNQLVVLAVDESAQTPTGCSIDASVAALRALPQAAPSLADLDLFDRSWVLYLDASGHWTRSRLHDFWAMRKAGTLTDDAQIFDATIPNLGALRTRAVVRLADSWHAHMW